MQGTFLSVNLLEGQAVPLLVEVVQAGTVPLLILFRIFLFQTTDVLSQLL